MVFVLPVATDRDWHKRMNDSPSISLATMYSMYLLELTDFDGVRRSVDTLFESGADSDTLIELAILSESDSRREDVLKLLESALSDPTERNSHSADHLRTAGSNLKQQAD